MQCFINLFGSTLRDGRYQIRKVFETLPNLGISSRYVFVRYGIGGRFALSSLRSIQSFSARDFRIYHFR